MQNEQIQHKALQIQIHKYHKAVLCTISHSTIPYIKIIVGHGEVILSYMLRFIFFPPFFLPLFLDTESLIPCFSKLNGKKSFASKIPFKNGIFPLTKSLSNLMKNSSIVKIVTISFFFSWIFFNERTIWIY